jgi:peptidoglycan/LPS O-acetylase OafA/YrhL
VSEYYRRDIDGLRAFAVVAVVIFHAFPAFIPGGFVGVDVFFVISGFLISGIIFKALDEGRFSFSDFYGRRVKRIFPALILVLVASFGFAWFVLFRDELKQLGHHISRAAVFLSNFALWRESGYFDNAAEAKPLLHLWSLGIEEQFYILWPVWVWAVWRSKRWRLHLMITVTLASFCWNIYQSQYDLIHDFYSPLTRFWELLCGALLAYVLNSRWEFSSAWASCWWRVANFRGTLGLAVLVLSVVVTESHGFPGVWAVLPVFGAMLVISADPMTGVNRWVFSNPISVWVGSISYPLYLWHWPIFSFARIIEGETPSVMLRVLCLFASVGLAWTTFVFVEKPLRFSWSYRYKTALLVVAMAGAGAMGYGAYKADGYPMRTAVQAQTVVHEGDIGHHLFHDYFKEHFYPCAEASIQNDAGAWNGIVRCFQSKPQARVDLVLLGDSHAEHLFLGIAEALPDLNVAIYAKGALPVLSAPEFKIIFDHLATQNSVHSVLFAANWAGKVKSDAAAKNLAVELDQTVKMLQSHNMKIYIMGDVPQFDFDPQRCKFQRPMTQSTKCDAPLASYVLSQRSYVPALQLVTQMNSNVYYVDPTTWMCTQIDCSMVRGGTLMYRDGNHLNIPGSQYVGREILKQHPSLYAAKKLNEASPSKP